MRLLVAGGSGAAGQVVVTRALARGHDVVAFSRNPGPQPPGVTPAHGDVTVAADVQAAMEGVEGVLDCTNVTTMSGRKAEEFFVSGTANLVRAGARAGVRHHVLLSIVGVDAFPFSYYRAKLAQEKALCRVATDAALAFTIARTTQFHDLADQMLARTRMGPLALIPPLNVQPVELGEVAGHLLSTVEGSPLNRAPDLAGPRPEKLTAMAREIAIQRGIRVRVLGMPLPPSAARANRARVLVPRDGVRGQVTFAEWLRLQR